jgi:hypothetical protein
MLNVDRILQLLHEIHDIAVPRTAGYGDTLNYTYLKTHLDSILELQSTGIILE